MINSKRKKERRVKKKKKKKEERKEKTPDLRDIYRIVNLAEEMGFDMGKSRGIECAKWV